MAVTPYVFLAVYALLAIATLARGPLYGLYLYAFAFYVSPEHTWWEGMVPDLRYLFIAAVLTLVSSIAYGSWSPLPRLRGVQLLVCFTAWIWIVSLWAITGDWQVRGRMLFLTHTVIAVMIIVVIRDVRDLRNWFIAHVVGAAWMGYQAWGKGGRLEGVAGALADANTLSMHLAAVLVIGSMLLLSTRGYMRYLYFLCLPLVLNTIILAASRGGFVALAFGGMLAGLYCPRLLRSRFLLYGGLAVVAFGVLVSDQFLERLSSLNALAQGGEQADAVSGHRLSILAAQMRMHDDYPLGTGYKGTAVLSPGYMDAHLLTTGGVRGAHNSYAALFVDLSYVGLLIYLAMYAWALMRLRAIKRGLEALGKADDGAIAAGIAGALGVVMVAGLGSNFYYAEVQYWLLAATAVMANHMDRTEAAPVQPQVDGQQSAHSPTPGGAPPIETGGVSSSRTGAIDQ